LGKARRAKNVAVILNELYSIGLGHIHRGHSLNFNERRSQMLVIPVRSMITSPMKLTGPAIFKTFAIVLGCFQRKYHFGTGVVCKRPENPTFSEQWGIDMIVACETLAL
jgi:hypothetical protein